MLKNFATPVRYLKGIGPQRARLLEKLSISSIEELLYYFPRRYEDRTSFKLISEIKEGELCTIKGRVLARGQRQSLRRRGFSIIEAAVADESGKIFCVWFNQPYLKDYFKPGEEVILYGKAEHYAKRLQMNSPEFEIISGSGKDEESLSAGRLVPIYSLPSGGISQRYFRGLVKNLLDEYLPRLNDFLPYDLRSRNNLLNLAKALANIHFPESLALQKQAYERLAFEEFFIFQLPLALRKLKKKEKQGIAHQVNGALEKSFLEQLPFCLTASQKKVIGEICSDMQQPQPMQRLLQGDVGSGKTVVATVAALIALQGGYQAAFMAPTEILARQHYEKISSQFTVYSPQLKQIKIALLTANAKEKEKLLKKIKEGEIDLVIGTHALLEQNVEFKRLGLVIIDEQHKFGVGQRQLLPQKGPNPDVLIMTATPIPRTLAITIYGDLDISVINEMPAGRLAVKTLHFSENEVSKAYALAKEQIRLGHQVYIVYPVIEESFALDISGAKKMFAQLEAREFREFSLGLIHGRLKQGEQEELMRKFRDKKIDLLIATTVLEVGIDIPNATCMIIEHAERFGLSQLHQLRGRVGRGQAESFCLLVSAAQSEEARARMEAMVRFHDGFRIAEEDLKLRGPGEFFGRRQHGLAELKIANPLTQLQLLKRAREEALKLVAADPLFVSRQNTLLKGKLLQRFPEYEKLILVG